MNKDRNANKGKDFSQSITEKKVEKSSLDSIIEKLSRNNEQPVDGRKWKKLSKENSVSKTNDEVNSLTDDEIVYIFRSIASPLSKLLLERSLRQSLISYNDAMNNVMLSMRTKHTLYALSIILREGGNPNFYVKDGESFGDRRIHILAYICHIWEKDDLQMKIGHVNMMLLLLVYYGSNPSFPVFENSYSSERPRPKREGDDKNSFSVLEWLDLQRYENDLDRMYPDYMENLDPDVIRSLALVTGDLKLLVVRGENKLIKEEENLLTAFSCRSILSHNSSKGSLLNAATIPKERNGMDYQVIYWSIDNFSVAAFTHYMLMGLGISYPLFNMIILKLRYYNANKNYVLRDIFSDMLDVAIRTGTAMDNEQLALLGSASFEIRDRLKKLYEVPFWMKTCTRQHSKGGIPQRLKDIAVHLEIEPIDDQASVCKQLQSISAMDTETVKRGLENRSKHRISARHGTIAEWISGSIPDLSCMRFSESDGDYSQYADVFRVSYRDVKGNVWCFPSYQFEQILEDGVNPVTGSVLPETLMYEISNKLKRISDMHQESKQVKTIDDVLQNLKREDRVSSKESEHKVEELNKILLLNKIRPDMLKDLKREDYNRAAVSGGYHGNLDSLSRRHAMITFAYIVVFYNNVDPSRSDMMIKTLSKEIFEEEVDVQQKWDDEVMEKEITIPKYEEDISDIDDDITDAE